jgi:PTS system nitrogen regulatory IIA component
MELKMKDVMDVFELPEKEIIRLIKSKALPVHTINHQNLFNKEEIQEWAIQNNITLSEKLLSLAGSELPVSISGLIDKGGIIYGIRGRNAAELLTDAVTRMKLPPEVRQDEVLACLIEREEMMPTGVGRGIAIPHPRNPIIADVDHESITVCSLASPVEYGAVDGKPVHTLFIILSANSKRHLEILSKLLFLCQQPQFVEMLAAGTPFRDVMEFITAAEAKMPVRSK